MNKVLLVIATLSIFSQVLALPSRWEILPKNYLASWNVAQIDAGISDYVWAIDTQGKAHVKKGLKGEWTELNDLEEVLLSWVSSGAAGIWSIKRELGIPAFRNGVTAARPLGKEWLETEGRGFKIIESGLTANVYGLTREGQLYYRHGITSVNSKGSFWKPIFGSYRHISAGSYGVWAIDFYERIFFGKGKSDGLGNIDNWIEISNLARNNVTYVITGFDGSVWALAKNGDVFQRESVNIINPTGSPYWKKINDLKLTQITAGLPGVIGLTNKQQVIGFKG